MEETYYALRRLARSRQMLAGVVFALVVGTTLAAYFVHGRGILDMPQWMVENSKRLTQIGVGIAITAGAFTNGLGAQQEYWRSNKGVLFHLLTLALILRGLGVAVMALMLGYDENVAFMIGAGLTATDPAAIGIALEFVRKPRDSMLLMLFWLYEIESVANDGISAIADEGFSGAGATTIFHLLYMTVVLGIGLAFSGEGARWIIRHDRVRRTIHFRYRELRKKYTREAQLEQIFTLCAVIVAMQLAYELGASPIGVIAIGMIIGSYIYHHRIESYDDVEEDVSVDEFRAQYHEIWTVVGLTLFLTWAIVLMPYRALIQEPIHLRNGLFILIGGIFLARLIYQAYYAVRFRTYRNRPLWWGYSFVSVLLATALLGVPTSTAAGMYAEGYTDASLDMFAAILVSWFIVPPAVIFIGWLSDKSNEEQEEIDEEELSRVPEIARV